MTDETRAVVPAPPPAPIVPDRPPTALLADAAHLAQIREIAALAMQAGGDMLPRNIKSKEQAAAIMIAGWEMGLRPMTALRHVYIVNGKTEVETRAMVGIIRARDPRIVFEWPEYTAAAVTCVLRRPGQPPVQVRYTIEDANASGQTRKRKQWVDGAGGKRQQVDVNGPWQLYRRDMLYAAATKRACRLGAPDLINAIEGNATTAEIIDADYTVREVPQMPPPDQGGDGPDYNPGDSPDDPLPAEMQADEADWRALGETVDAEPAAAGAGPDPDLVRQAHEAWAGVAQNYAPFNVAQARGRVQVEGKVTKAGNIAWSRYTDAELRRALDELAGFEAQARGGRPTLEPPAAVSDDADA